MNQVHKHQKIAYLITKELLQTINEDEANELSDWLNADPNNIIIYQRLKEKDYTKNILAYRQIEPEAGLIKYRQRYKSPTSPSLIRWLSVAAVITVLFSIGISLLFHPGNKELTVTGLQPGSSKALLILADGTTHELAEIPRQETIQVQGITIQNDGKAISYTPLSDTLMPVPTEEMYNILKIPTGGEYMLMLSDGTKVWLNSQTTLRYPVNFGGLERKVELEGEAYFEVARDEKKPFYVTTKNNINIQVLGTSFNVRAYSDEQETETVLEEGAVKMWRDSQSVTLTPGIRAIYNKQELQFCTETVNTELYTAWRTGQYIFEEETIENILHKLSRWYDMNVFFADHAAKNLVFSGNIRKYETIQTLLQAIEATGGVHFEIKNNTILVNSVSK